MSSFDKSLVTVVLADTGREWTMSIMESEDDSDPSLQRDRLKAAIDLIGEGDVLYGCWGTITQYRGAEVVAVFFPGATRVQAAYQ